MGNACPTSCAARRSSKWPPVLWPHAIIRFCHGPSPKKTSYTVRGLTRARKAFRRFLHATIAPAAELVQEELREKLDSPSLVLSFDALFAADVQGRARAWRSLAGNEAALDPQTAARLVGLNDRGEAA